MLLYRGGDGSTKENAIVILAQNEFEGVNAEYEYLENKYGEVEVESQTFLGEVDKQKANDLFYLLV